MMFREILSGWVYYATGGRGGADRLAVYILGRYDASGLEFQDMTPGQRVDTVNGWLREFGADRELCSRLGFLVDEWEAMAV